jgi:hypothetical protein
MISRSCSSKCAEAEHAASVLFIVNHVLAFIVQPCKILICRIRHNETCKISVISIYFIIHVNWVTCIIPSPLFKLNIFSISGSL